jgi:chromosome segregation ATPase
MTRFDDSHAEIEQKNDSLMVLAELRQRKYASDDRLRQLKEQCQALGEIRDSLENEEKNLTERLGIVLEECIYLDRKIGSASNDSLDLETENDELKHQLTELDRQWQASTSQQKELAKEVEVAERNLANARVELARVSNELESSRAALVRIEKRLLPKNVGRD